MPWDGKVIRVRPAAATAPELAAAASPKGRNPGRHEQWTKTFTYPRLCAAIVDRLTFGGNILETGTDSYRLAQTRAQQHAALPS